jgi:hypothetical protein
MYLRLALSFSDRLLEPAITVENEKHWDDKKVMQTVNKTYWGAKGMWKGWLSMQGLWPWKVLQRMGHAKVSLFTVFNLLRQMRAFHDVGNPEGYTQCEKLHPHPLESYIQCEQLHSLSIRATTETCTPPTNLQWMTYFNHPERCKAMDTYLRDHLPKHDRRVEGGYRGQNITVLYFEHALAVGVMVIMMGIIIISSIISLCWAVMKNDVSGGFGIGAFLIAVATLVAAILRRGLV